MKHLAILLAALLSALPLAAPAQPLAPLQCGTGATKHLPEMVFMSYSYPTPSDMKGRSGSAYCTAGNPCVSFAEMRTNEYGYLFTCTPKGASNTRDGVIALIKQAEEKSQKGATPILIKIVTH